ncbi:hypothetical protein ACLB2K_057193 [Fragaria x ananassa]
MVEDIQYRSYSGAGRNLEMLNVRSLSENYNTMYSDRYTPSQCLSWVPPSATPPPFLVERIRQQQHDHRQFGKAEQKRGLAEVPRSKNKRFKLWWNDAEVKRRRRVAKYKLYGAEGKMKMSFKRGYRWFKKKCLQISLVNGPRSPVNDPRSLVNGPRSPVNSLRCPIIGPRSPVNGPRSPVNCPRSPVNGPRSPVNVIGRGNQEAAVGDELSISHPQNLSAARRGAKSAEEIQKA